MNDELTLWLAEFDAWQKQREEYSEREEDNPVTSSMWEISDDRGTSLAFMAAHLIRGLVEGS